MDALLSLSGHAALPLDILLGLTLLSLLPFLIILTTSFLRITIVLSLVRSAIGASALPPNAALTGIALALTCVVMAPTTDRIMRDAVVPYSQGHLSRSLLIARAVAPLREFMIRQTQRRDLAIFAHLAHDAETERPQDLPFDVVMPAFVVNELRSGFGIGFALYLPFVAIDLAVASILMGMGMMMISPTVVSLPCKLFLFVMVDGWALVCTNLVQSFR